MTIRLTGDTGFVIESADRSQSVDLMQKRAQMAGAIESAQRLTRYMIPMTIDGTEIKNLAEAEQALIDGTLPTNEFGGRTIVFVINRGVPVVYYWDEDSQLLHKVGEPQGNNFLNLTGANYIEFDNNMELFDFNKSWFMSIQTLTLNATGAFQGLFSLGDNSFNFLAGSGNYGVYLDDREPVTQGGSARANTWHDPATLRIMLNYNHVAQKLEYWTGSQGGTPTLIKNLDVNLYQGDPSQLFEQQPADAKLCIGKGLSGSNHFQGEVNDFIAGNTYLGSSTVQMMFNATRDDVVVMPEVNYHASIGEDDWPAISSTGGLTGGKVVGGTENDFKPVSE